MKFENFMILEFPSRSANEAFARSAVACFAAQLQPWRSWGISAQLFLRQ